MRKQKQFDSLAIARDLLARGYAVVPVPIGKSPNRKNWQHLTITEKNLPKYFNGAAINVGVIWGPKSNNRWDTDLDCAEAVKLAPYFLPKTDAIYGRPSKRRSHYLYQGSGTTQTKPQSNGSTKTKRSSLNCVSVAVIRARKASCRDRCTRPASSTNGTWTVN